MCDTSSAVAVSSPAKLDSNSLSLCFNFNLIFVTVVCSIWWCFHKVEKKIRLVCTFLHSSSAFELCARERMQMSRRSLGDFRLPLQLSWIRYEFQFFCFAERYILPELILQVFLWIDAISLLSCAALRSLCSVEKAQLSHFDSSIDSNSHYTTLCSLHCIFMHNWLLLTFFSFCSHVLSYFLHFANCNLLLLLFFHRVFERSSAKNKKQIHFDILSRIRVESTIETSADPRWVFFISFSCVPNAHCWMQCNVQERWQCGARHKVTLPKSICVTLLFGTQWQLGCLVARCVHRLARVSAAFWAQREQHSKNKKSK